MMPVKTKNRRIFNNTIPTLESPEENPVSTERTMIPIMSSIRAALSKIVPVLVFSLPISFNVSTVIPTEVAEKTAPTKAAFNTL